MDTYYLGAHHPNWLEQTEVPLFVSRRVLYKRKKRPRARGRWARDSGGFTQLQLCGSWDDVSPKQFVHEARIDCDDVGKPDFIAPRDWMCEPIVIAGGTTDDGVKFAGTGLSVKTHQILTVQDLLTLRMLAPDLPIIPVLQGWTLDDYLRCWDYYDMAGIVLENEPIVGIGSICRRQATTEVVQIIERLYVEGLRKSMHAFGVKTAGLPKLLDYIRSADSQARSMHARITKALLPGHDKPGPGRPRGHKTCANCLEYLVGEYHAMLEKVKQRQPRQISLWSML